MIMTVPEIMHEIEQHRFSSELNVVSGARAFRSALREHSLFKKLLELANDAGVRTAIMQRIQDLAAAVIDMRYENQYDAALSAYLMVLGDTAEPEDLERTLPVAAEAPNLWWAAGIIRELMAKTAPHPTIS